MRHRLSIYRNHMVAVGVSLLAAVTIVLTCQDGISGAASTERPAGPTLPENTWVEHLPVDGKLVTCVFRSAYGISCDWANAQPLDAGTPPTTTPPTR